MKTYSARPFCASILLFTAGACSESNGGADAQDAGGKVDGGGGANDSGGTGGDAGFGDRGRLDADSGSTAEDSGQVSPDSAIEDRGAPPEDSGLVDDAGVPDSGAGDVGAMSNDLGPLPFPDAGPIDATALGTLAFSLGQNEWAELPSVNITPTLDNLGGASGVMTSYTDDLVWDPTSLRAFLIGADHLAPEGPQFAAYDAPSNSWLRLPRPMWLSSLVFFHGYDHSALDPVRRTIYHRPFGQNMIHRSNVDNNNWAPLPAANLVNTYENCCDALEYFPPLDGLVWVRGVGEVWLYNENLLAWRQLGTWNEDGNTWSFAEYNPVHQVLIFGSGNADNLYKLSSAGVVSPLNTPPISIYDGSGYVGVLTVDPRGGDYLLLTPGARALYRYDVNLDTWTAHSSTNKPDLSDEGVVATPVSTYGVVLFASCSRGNCRSYLYRHQ